MSTTFSVQPNIYGYTIPALEQYLCSIGEKPTKAPYIFRGLYRHRVTSLTDIPDLRHSLLERMQADFCMKLPKLLEQITTEDTVKFLFSMEDGGLIEAVLMKQAYGNSLCISSQLGCNMACAFCQSGRFKKQRNLTAAEMTGQVLLAEQISGLKISNVVLMGIGEPFDNYENITDFVSIITSDLGMAIGHRHVTVSTCGLAPQIVAYAQHPDHAMLAISLHAPDDETRSRIMPINRRYSVAQVMEAAREYIRITNKPVMLEYTMMAGINDTPEQAQLLCEIIGSDDFHVNLIPYNDTQNLGFAKSSVESIKAFYNVLKQNNVVVTMRRRFGSEVNAACGQLRANYENTQ